MHCPQTHPEFFFGDKYWGDMQESKLIIGENQSEDVEDWMNEQVIPSLEFSGLTDEQLYYIFTDTTPTQHR